MRKFAVALTLFSASFSLAAPTVNDCRRFFNYPDGTNKLISYVESISNLPSLNLQKFYQAVAHGELENPISASTARVNAELQIHRNGLSSILDNSYLDIEKLKSWASARVALEVKTQNERHSTRQETASPFRQFKMVQVNEMQLMVMDGPVTEMMWAEVFGVVPEELLTANSSRRDPIWVNNKLVTISPDYPVTNMTFWSAAVFANQMSKKRGLPEAYDLSMVKFDGVNSKQDIVHLAALGLLSSFDSNSVEEFVQNNTPQMVATRGGLRFPTRDEFETLVCHLARFNGVHLSKLDPQQIQSLFKGKSRDLHPVGSELGAAMIGANSIADLIAHISFYTSNIKKYDDPNKAPWEVTTVGRDYSTWEVANIFTSSTQGLSDYFNHRGIILVRTVQP